MTLSLKFGNINLDFPQISPFHPIDRNQPIYTSPSQRPLIYEGAKNAMFYKEEEEEGQAVYIDEIEPLLDEKFVLYDQNVDLIIQ